MSKRWRSKSTFFFCAFLLILLAGSMRIQAEPEKLTFGLNVGPVFSNHWSTEDAPEGVEKPKGESGFSVGVYMNLSLGKRFSLQGEIGYAEKGAKHNLLIEGFPYGPVDVTYNTEHIEIPIWLKFYVIKGKKFRIYTGGGGYIAFLTNGWYLFENEVIPSFTADMDDIKKTDLGFLFQWGLEFKVGDFFVHLEYRYSMGLIDISYPTGPDAPGVELRNLAHAALLGVSFTSD
jgi:opacity protein-like surface antigen